MNTTELFDALSSEDAGMRALLDEHVAYYEEVIPYLALGEITLQALKELRRLIGHQQAEGMFWHLVGVLDRNVPSLDEATRDIVVQSFAEHVASLSVTEKELYGRIVSNLPDHLRRMVTELLA